jgi:hypothetical protein
MLFRRPLVGLALLAALSGGCSSTEQIRTAPPQPARAITGGPADAEPRAVVTVLVATGETPLPEAVQALRFRVAEVQLRQSTGSWVVHPADANTFEIRDGQPLRKAVLTTRIPPAVYDSLAFSLTNVYVEYDDNAGGPLTMPREEPLRLPIAFETLVDRPTTLLLTVEPGASLSRDPGCRWFFLPFVTASLVPQPGR